MDEINSEIGLTQLLHGGVVHGSGTESGAAAAPEKEKTGVLAENV